MRCLLHSMTVLGCEGRSGDKGAVTSRSKGQEGRYACVDFPRLGGGLVFSAITI